MTNSRTRAAALQTRTAALLPALLALVLSACGGAAATVAPVEALRPVETRVVDGTFTITGTLDPDDPADEVGARIDRYVLEVEAGDLVRLTLRSEAIDTVLRADAPGGLTLRNDDLWDGTNSMLQLEARADGEILVDVTSYAPTTYGPYELQVMLVDPATDGATLRDGDRWEGTIDAMDRALGVSASGFFRAEGGERIQLRAASAEMDMTAWLLGPGGETWFNDDANDTGPGGTGSTLDSALELVAPSTGWYQLVVAPYDRTSRGGFGVTFSRRPPVVVRDGAEIPNEGYAGARQEGRIHGLFVGISDYSANDQLYGTADDARNLAEAFRTRHLQRAMDQIVLTDEIATVENFRNAMGKLASRAAPEDMVFIFFSGHGTLVTEQRGPHLMELDGTDETIVLRDGMVRDWEFAAMLDELPSKLVVVAIDACNAGGFARDMMTRAGRIGIFSSDEDVLSSTAEPVGAGGYLSYSLLRAISGAADSRPADGALTAGELADFLIDDAVVVHELMNPTGSMSPRQRFIIERGSFQWNDLLWIYPRREDGTPFEAGVCAPPEAVQGGGPAGPRCQ